MTRTLVDESARTAYERDGFVCVRGLFETWEMDRALAEADRLAQRRDLIRADNLRCRWKDHIETGQCLFECFDPVIDLSPVIAEIARDRRLFEVLETIYGDEPCLLKDKLIFKPAGAKGYELHQDFIAWPCFPRTFVTALVALERTAPDNGCTILYPGCHTFGALSPEDGDYHPLPWWVVDRTRAVPLVLEPGDTAFFGCFTPHESGPNRSEGWRRQLYLSYNARADGGDQRERHYQDFHAWLRKKYAEHGRPSVTFE